MRFPLARTIVNGLGTKTSEYRLLRVLGEHHYLSQGDYYGNVNLRYLDYRQRDSGASWKLPTSVSLIWNMQTLIIENAYKSFIVAPTEFWEMRQLRHVKCCSIFIPSPSPSNGLLILENLQTLESVVNFRLSEEVCKIIPNIKKLYLVYDRKLTGYDDSLIECVCNLDRLHKLESLKLIVNFFLRDRELHVKLASPLPRSLKKLTLRWYSFPLDDMTIISSLPQLEVLNLEALYIQWTPVDGQFLRLKFLKNDTCNLVRWDAEESHFPCLQKLHLELLSELEEIPLCIGDIPTLELIQVDYCSNSSAISAVRIKEDQLENGGQLQVQVKVWKSRMESFSQMLETEGLTTDNIQLEIDMT